MPTDRTALAADLQRLWQLRPEMKPKEWDITSDGVWLRYSMATDYYELDGNHHDGGGAALLAIVEANRHWLIGGTDGKWAITSGTLSISSPSILRTAVLVALAEATR